MMCPAIDNPASCEIRAVMHFLHAKNMSAAEILRELCVTVYGHDEERSGRSSLVSDDLLQILTKNFVKDGS
jgi:hypothetical protein